jgi:hypothetical protein
MSLSTSNRYLAFLSVMLLMAYKWQCIPKKQGILMALQYIMKMNQLIHKTARNSPICEVLHEAIIQLHWECRTVNRITGICCATCTGGQKWDSDNL